MRPRWEWLINAVVVVLVGVVVLALLTFCLVPGFALQWHCSMQGQTALDGRCVERVEP